VALTDHHGLKLKTGPTIEPVTVEDVQLYSRVTVTAERPLLERLIPTARRQVESDSSVLLITQTWTLYLDKFPSYPGTLNEWISSGSYLGNVVEIPLRPVQSVTTVKYYDTAGTLQTANASTYQVDINSFIARIRPVTGTTWPATQDRLNAVEIEFVGGFGATAAAVPEPMKQAICLLVGHHYEHREAGEVMSMNLLPMGYRDLINTEKVWHV
jgi:uncharacterized phiE125 gp8 family phage protein